MMVQTRMKKHRAVWRFAPLSATFTASPSSWLRCLEAVRGGAKQSYFLTPRRTSAMRLPRRRAHARARRTRSPLAPCPSPAPLAVHSLPWVPALVGREEKCWQLSSPDLSPNNFVTLHCQLNSQIHLSQMSFNFHTSSTCYSLESFISEHSPGAPAVWQYPYPNSAEVWNSTECLFVLYGCIVTRIMIMISFTERYNVTSPGTYMWGVICRSICIITSVVFSVLAVHHTELDSRTIIPFLFFASGLVQSGSLFRCPEHKGFVGVFNNGNGLINQKIWN